MPHNLHPTIPSLSLRRPKLVERAKGSVWHTHSQQGVFQPWLIVIEEIQIRVWRMKFRRPNAHTLRRLCQCRKALDGLSKHGTESPYNSGFNWGRKSIRRAWTRNSNSTPVWVYILNMWCDKHKRLKDWKRDINISEGCTWTLEICWSNLELAVHCVRIKMLWS